MSWIKENQSLVVIFLIIGVAIIFIMAQSIKEGNSLAWCIKKSGAKFYGSKTCPYCISQKQAFGESAKDLPYVECTSESGEKICSKKDIKGYPTWIFPDGTRKEGEVSINELAIRTKCINKIK